MTAHNPHPDLPLDFTIGQMRGAIDVLRSPSDIDRERFIGLLTAWIARLERTP